MAQLLPAKFLCVCVSVRLCVVLCVQIWQIASQPTRDISTPALPNRGPIQFDPNVAKSTASVTSSRCSQAASVKSTLFNESTANLHPKSQHQFRLRKY
ncbi:hypothetical protein T12_2320 [Trichinella patagoniensis]|uniref:Secreted protein n=1 Tax=Trichinella patagoniensis TaxID=990121 RepID=A0A0V0ZS53_9BILA|nr:hypothetical protein T12_2320 [Trichinella patagoniensis]